MAEIEIIAPERVREQPEYVKQIQAKETVRIVNRLTLIYWTLVFCLGVFLYSPYLWKRGANGIALIDKKGSD